MQPVIETKVCSDLRGRGRHQLFWFEVGIAADFRNVSVLTLLRGQIMDHGLQVIGSAFRFSERLDLGEVSQELHMRNIHLRRGRLPKSSLVSILLLGRKRLQHSKTTKEPRFDSSGMKSRAKTPL